MYDEVKDDDSCKQIAQSIRDCPRQFVHADTGLILTLIMPLEEIRDSLMDEVLSFAPHTNYSIFRDLAPSSLDGTRGKITVVHNAEIKEELYRKHTNYVKTLF